MSTPADALETFLLRCESDVVLRNGKTLHVRPVRETDREGLLDLFTHLSADSLHFRFFDFRKPEAALESTPYRVDYDDEFGLVGELGGKVEGVVHYFRSRKYPERAEVAFTVSDRLQGCGVGTRLLERLAEVARERGITTFVAEVLEDNRKMMDVFLDSGFTVTRKSDEGGVRVSLSLERTAEFEEKSADRAQKAASASMKSIFEPKGIAVVGASRKAGSIGGELFRNLIRAGFQGRLYPVNPTTDEVEYIPAYKSVRDIPGDVDLALIVVAADYVEAAIDDCIAKGVRGVVVITAGFSEIGPEGRAREEKLVEKLRSAGMRMVGPNCMGVINTDRAVRMHGTFSRVWPPPGNVAMSTQSGALGLAILDYASQLNIGFSTFISVGNKADVSGNDLVQYWAEDPHTDVILLYLESFGNPKKFGTIARRVSHKKPIVAVKSGRSRSGARAASSHTGALTESDVIVGELFRQAGIIRTDTLEELFDVAAVLAHQPLPAGRRVAILTNAGGPAILAADACEARGLELAHLADETLASLREFLPRTASVRNPVDMIASAGAVEYEKAMRLLLADPGVDSLLLIYIPVVPEDADVVAGAVRDAYSANHNKPVVGTFMSARGVPPVLAPIPCFPFPERAAGALARATNYAEWRRKPEGLVRQFDDISKEKVRAIVEPALARGGGWLDPEEASSLLEAAGIPVARTVFAQSPDAAASAARAAGYPVVLKVAGQKILHKSDVGGVRLGIADEKELRAVYAELTERFGADLEGIIVQPMIAGGVEMVVGATLEATFGHVIAFGSGGTLVELLADIAFKLHPVSDLEAADMLERVRGTKLMRGFRGSPKLDEDAAREMVQRVSWLIELVPEIQEMDVNPLKVLETGVVAVDFRVRLGRAEPKRSRRVTY
ncbi:MAG TPA: GNAT family N-acetyltransferase [Thermoanaerobaculia bacterium]|nr:GNAT family N-acetyltransferase [Thermoanaerobaculia bacterium]